MFSRLKTGLAAAFITTSLGASAQANGTMTLGQPVAAPIGYIDMCQRNPKNCAGDDHMTREQPVEVTPHELAVLEAFNRIVNATIAPVSDQEHFGKLEHWTFPKLYGQADCEDYVLYKRNELIKRGYPRSALLITVVKTPAGEGHAILTLRTKKRDYAIDNIENRILPVSETGYEFVKAQNPQYPFQFLEVTHMPAHKAKIPNPQKDPIGYIALRGALP